MRASGRPGLSASTGRRLRDRVVTVGDRDELTVLAPYTETAVGTVPSCEPADVEAAVTRARRAQSDWAERPVDVRAGVLRRFADEVVANRSSLLDLVQLETGKARRDAIEEVLDVVLTARYYARRGPAHLASRRRNGALPALTRVTEHADPVGVVGCITPWNYPLTLAVSDLMPALLAGNGAVLKPAEETPFTALRIMELLESAGLPTGLVCVVTGAGEPLGEPLVAGVDHLTFTGSTATGRSVAALASEHLVDASLELGGKNPAIVLSDADLGAAVRGLCNGAFANAGQLCIGTERIYVVRDVYEPFRAAFVEVTRDLKLGATYDFGPDVGSLISAVHRQTVEDHVSDALDRGATVATGGAPAPEVGPLFYQPTVLTDLPADATAASVETFGPVVSVTPVADAAEAVERANGTEYGLHASVWTGDSERGAALARHLEAGTVSVNDAYRAMWASTDAPMGGVKDSGVGRRHGRQGIERYVEPQTVVTQRGPPLATPGAVPDRVAAAGTLLGVRIVDVVRRLLD